MVKIILKQFFLVFINIFVYLVIVMILLVVLKKYGKDIGFYLVGIGFYKFDIWNQMDFVKVSKFDGYWQLGLLKLDFIIWCLVVDNNIWVVMLQIGEVQFVFLIFYEQVLLLVKNSKLELVVSLLIMQCYISMNVMQKLFDNLKVWEVINYVINCQVLVKVVFVGYVILVIGVVLLLIVYVQIYIVWLYDLVKVCQLLKEVGYFNGFSIMLWLLYNYSIVQKVLQFIQQQLVQVGIKVQVMVMDVGQWVVEVEGKGQKESGVWMFYIGWFVFIGEVDWVLLLLFVL